MSRRRILFGTVLLAFGFAACDDDPATPPEENEQEFITEVTVTLTPQSGGAAMTSSVIDPDGPGTQGPDPATLTFMLTPGETYDGTVEFWDRQDPSNPEDITEEVAEEDDEHRVFHILTGLTDVAVPDESLDLDGNGAPLGLVFQIVADSAAMGTGSLQIILSHYDDTPKGDGSVQSNETDADVMFPVTVNVPTT